jgi:DamX protein
MKIDRLDKPASSPALTLVAGAAEHDRSGVTGAASLSPFRQAWPDVHLFVTDALQQALDAAEQAARTGEQVVLVEGEPGAGKTSFLRRLAQRFDADTRICHIEARLALGERHVLARVAEVYGCPPVSGIGELASLLARVGAGQTPLLLIIDNADRLSRFALRALFELKRRVFQGGGRLALIVSASPDTLDATLALPSFSNYGKDWLHRIELPRFSEQETAAWLRHLIEAAGMQETVSFDSAQIRRIHKAGHGLPRQIRRVADDVLNGRKPRRWRSRRDESTARRRKYRLVGAAISIMALIGIAWLLAALISGPPRIELAFDSPLSGVVLPDEPSLPLLPLSAGMIDPPRVEEPPAEPAARPPAPAQAPLPAASPEAAPQAAASDTLTGHAWLMAQAPERYTVQLASSPDRALAEQFVERNPLDGKTMVITTRRGERILHLVIYGSFAGPAAAREAIAALPPQLRRNDPFARTMQSMQSIATGG